MSATYQYDPGEQPKRKHGWSRTYAGFDTVGGNEVGKCPQDLRPEIARNLLNRDPLVAAVLAP